MLENYQKDNEYLERIFHKASNSLYANTSYPLDKSNWEEYKIETDTLFESESDLSLYIHIPFCTKLCAFCEYVKFKKENNEYEQKYLDILEKDIDKFLANHSFKLYGFDIGGGTPTSLNLDNFKKLMSIATKINMLQNKAFDYEPSIEATFDTIDEEKVKLIEKSGFKRISFGIQTTNTKILNSQNRNIVTLDKMLSVFNMLRENNIKKINVDFMYGIKNQTLNDIKTSIECIEILKPEHVTLYEMRYNLIKNKEIISKEELFNQYKLIYSKLKNLGYIGNFGSNTFSKNKSDLGLSSYLRYRMIKNISYKGFGISAQSKSKLGISYNIGKNHESIEECFKKNSFYSDDIYLLPKEELVAKYIMISLYYGQFDLGIISTILSCDAFSYYKKELDYLISNNYILVSNDKVNITEKGFKYYGAIGALFYSKNVRNWFSGD